MKTLYFANISLKTIGIIKITCNVLKYLIGGSLIMENEYLTLFLSCSLMVGESFIRYSDSNESENI